ncbi:MAG: tyrosine--tRNA ligase [Alphaproteobacteria bacterium]
MSGPSAEVANLVRGAVEVLPRAEFEEKVAAAAKTGRPLRVKFGADPSAPDLHLGHMVVLRKLAQFQQAGHKVVFLVGDFTGMIGDPTGKSETRKALSREDVLRNARTYEEQVFRVLDRDRTEVRFNSEWMDAMKAADMVRLCARYTVARILERDDFAKRMREQRAIGIHEFLYPLVQGYDSVALEADVEVGGTDQKFNLLVGRELQKAWGQGPQAILTMPLLEGLDGSQKMSKSLGNAIGIADPPSEMFGRLMSISDDLMGRYAELLSDRQPDLRERVANGLHPMEAKKSLAAEIVERHHGSAAAEAARAIFEQRFQHREAVAPEVFDVEATGGEGVPVAKLLHLIGFANSSSEARRKIAQQGVRVDGEVVSDPMAFLRAGAEYLVAVGSRRLGRVRVSPRGT